jgi:hypothetical protein
MPNEFVPMSFDHFDPVARSLMAKPPGRGFLRGPTGFAVGLAALGSNAAAEARNWRRMKTPQRNAFGCLNVGQKCRGKDALGYSGRCGGKKPERGRKVRRTCVAHDTGGRAEVQPQKECGGHEGLICTSPSGLEGVCKRATGNAGFCAVSGDCFPRRKDADCQPLCGLGAACVFCEASCSFTGGTAWKYPSGTVAAALPGQVRVGVVCLSTCVSPSLVAIRLTAEPEATGSVPRDRIAFVIPEHVEEDVMNRGYFANVTRRATVLNLSAGALAALVPPSTIDARKKRTNGKPNKLCKKQIGQCFDFFTPLCEEDPECLAALATCCPILGRCDFGRFVACSESETSIAGLVSRQWVP